MQGGGRYLPGPLQCAVGDACCRASAASVTDPAPASVRQSLTTAAMDLYDSDNVSSESSGEREYVGEVLPGDAVGQRVDIGRRAELCGFSGPCMGDAVSWVGSKVMRVIALQSGGTRANREH